MNPILQPNPDFRPDHTRCIVICGEIDQSAVDRLTPQVVSLLGTGRRLTLYIDSPGGSTYHAESISRNVRMLTQDDTTSNRVIGVGLNFVASAAADLLISTDYAILQPHTQILCHGVRRSADGLSVTRETASDLARNLAQSNESYALQTARSAIGRFIFRVVMLRAEFPAIREANPEIEGSDAECFVLALEKRVSPRLSRVLRQALVNILHTELIDLAARKEWMGRTDKPSSDAEFEGMILGCIIKHELEYGGDGFSFRERGLGDVQARLELLTSSHDPAHKAQISRLIQAWGESLLDLAANEELKDIPAAERTAWIENAVQPAMQSLWFFFVALCRLLQENENYMSAEEAYWIGLVDEVIGRSDLLNARMLVEYQTVS